MAKQIGQRTLDSGKVIGVGDVRIATVRNDDGTVGSFVITIDATSEPRLSASECSEVLASTGGNISLPELPGLGTFKIGLNLFRAVPADRLSDKAKAHKAESRAKFGKAPKSDADESF